MLKKYSWILVVAAFALVFWLGQQSGKQQDATLPNTSNEEIGGTDNRSVAKSLPPRNEPQSQHDSQNTDNHSPQELPSFLPKEARRTLELIASDGPFPHRQDGVVFQNREKRLPKKQRGYYHEYTVETPGLSHRGAKRIVTGGEPIEVYYYTDDHYDSFREFEVK